MGGCVNWDPTFFRDPALPCLPHVSILVALQEAPTTRAIPLVSPSFKLQFASSIMTESCPIHIAIAVPASLMRVVRPFVHFHLDPVD